MALDPRAPVVVGAGQLTVKDAPPSPAAMAAEAVRAAAADAGADVLPRVQALGVVDPFSWPVVDPGALVRAELGLADDVHSLKSAIGGTGPIVLLGALAQRIADGTLDCAVLVGAEVVSVFMKVLRGGEDPGWPVNPDGTPAPETLGEAETPSHPLELQSGLLAPVMYYPLFEHALRVSAGRTVEEQAARASQLWQRYAAVARTNPLAWTPDPVADPGEVTEDNRLVAHPYPKYETANIQVDQAAALIVMSAGAAADAGVPEDRMVPIHATSHAHDHWYPGNRFALDRSPAIRANADAIGLDVDAIAHLDLYSCFPSAVQMAGLELGIDPVTDARPPTVTGGLTFAGGPANNYVTHSLATMVGVLRDHPADTGMCTAVGWYMTKHGIAVLGGREADAPAFADHHPQAVVDALPSREVATEPVEATVETYTSLYDRDGSATMGIVVGLTEDGRRTFGKTDDGAGVVAADPIGATAQFDGAGAVTL